jgi:hypothetical protein
LAPRTFSRRVSSPKLANIASDAQAPPRTMPRQEEGLAPADSTARWLLSSPGESHPEALPELYVSVSTHTAPMVINRLRWCSQSASRLG